MSDATGQFLDCKVTMFTEIQCETLHNKRDYKQAVECKMTDSFSILLFRIYRLYNIPADCIET